jgi:glucose repression mediator protein
MAADAAQRERDEKLHQTQSNVPIKRQREWEDDDGVGKKQPTEENRARMEDVHHHRGSPPPQHRRDSVERQREEYHHAPPAPHSIHNLNHTQLPPMSEPRMPERRDEPKEVIEPAARKVEEDDEYDVDDEDVKREGGQPPRHKESNSSPNSKGGANGISNGGDKRE